MLQGACPKTDPATWIDMLGMGLRVRVSPTPATWIDMLGMGLRVRVSPTSIGDQSDQDSTAICPLAQLCNAIISSRQHTAAAQEPVDVLPHLHVRGNGSSTA